MFVTDQLGAVTRVVLETLRTLCVWLLNLGLFYVNIRGTGKLGEPWGPTSYLQAIGELHGKWQAECSILPYIQLAGTGGG